MFIKFDTKLEFRETERNRSRSKYDQPPAASRLPPRKARPVRDLEEVKSRFIFEEKAVFVEGATFKSKTCLCLSSKVRSGSICLYNVCLQVNPIRFLPLFKRNY